MAPRRRAVRPTWAVVRRCESSLAPLASTARPPPSAPPSHHNASPLSPARAWRAGGQPATADAHSTVALPRPRRRGILPERPGRSCDGGRWREDPRPDHDRPRQPHRRECCRGEIRAARLGSGGRDGARRRAQQAACRAGQARSGGRDAAIADAAPRQVESAGRWACGG